MGTRNLTIVKAGNKVFGQYGQWDGYPEGQGATVLDFIKRFDPVSFRARFERTVLLTDAEVKTRWDAAIAESGGPAALDGFVTMATADKFREKNAHLSRDHGAKILDYIDAAENPEVHDNLEFAADSLFCEWAWMLDLDAGTLRCFKGFNKTPLAEGDFFYYLEPQANGEYHPIKEIQTIPFETAKTMTRDEFIALFVEPEEE